MDKELKIDLAKADAQKACLHRVIQPYENEDEDIQVCVECDRVVHEGRAFKSKPGRLFRPTIEGFHTSQE